ncbi:hypothetical protein BN1723_020572, partial [Verticillium longisporum]
HAPHHVDTAQRHVQRRQWRLRDAHEQALLRHSLCDRRARPWRSRRRSRRD